MQREEDQKQPLTSRCDYSSVDNRFLDLEEETLDWLSTTVSRGSAFPTICRRSGSDFQRMVGPPYQSRTLSTDW